MQHVLFKCIFSQSKIQCLDCPQESVTTCDLIFIWPYNNENWFWLKIKPLQISDILWYLLYTCIFLLVYSVCKHVKIYVYVYVTGFSIYVGVYLKHFPVVWFVNICIRCVFECAVILFCIYHTCIWIAYM